MLKQRLLTAAVLIPLVVLAILALPTSIFQLLLAIVVGLAAWEWFSMIGFKTQTQMGFAMMVLLFITVLGLFLSTTAVLFISLLVWLSILLLVAYFAHRNLTEKVETLFIQPVLALIMASLVLALFWLSAVQLHQTVLGPQQLLYVMILVWLADTGGYFAGKRWGSRALANVISPNKTWEGVAGALVLGGIWAIIGFYLDLAGSLSLFSWLLLSLVSLFISIIGDLFESLFKRCHNVKDSGNLLPGHGGMLDRVDSLIAAIPVFTAGLYFLGA